MEECIMKKKIITIILVLGVVAGISGMIYMQKGKNKNVENAAANVSDLPVYAMKADFVYDTENINESVGIVDYVFLGEVVSKDETTYEDVVPMEDAKGKTVEEGTPYTHYSIRVKENIKGELEKEKEIKIVKHGGVAQDKKSVVLFDEDCLPKVGKQYIFLAYAQQDGSLLISGPNSNILASAKKQETVVNEYEKAVKQEKVNVDRERYTSEYDKKAGNAKNK